MNEESEDCSGVPHLDPLIGIASVTERQVTERQGVRCLQLRTVGLTLARHVRRLTQRWVRTLSRGGEGGGDREGGGGRRGGGGGRGGGGRGVEEEKSKAVDS